MSDRPLTTPPAGWTDTRLAAHRLAAYVISPARRQATGRIGLRAARAGVYETPPFGDDARVVRLAEDRIVAERGGARRESPIGTLTTAARFVLGGPPDVEYAGQFDVPPPGDPDEPLRLDPAAAAMLGELFRFAWDVLGTLRDEAGADASEIQLWPEHFDAAVDAPLGAGRITFGVSPGDATSEQPYLYVLPPGAVEPGEVWNASGFTGAVLPLSELLRAPDQRAAALAFLRARRDAAAA